MKKIGKASSAALRITIYEGKSTSTLFEESSLASTTQMREFLARIAPEVCLLATGQVSAALDALQQQGRVREIPNADERTRSRHIRSHAQSSLSRRAGALRPFAYLDCSKLLTLKKGGHSDQESELVMHSNG